MKQLKYRIKTLSPLLVTNNTGDPNMVSTKEYISGTAILGALAGMYIAKNNLTNAHKDPEFNSWFLNGSLKFTNAYIISYNERNQIMNNCPIPISIQKDKDDENAIYDLLYNETDKATKIIGGFGKMDNGSIYEQKIRKSLNFHHERDPLSGTTKKGIIFNYESIDAGQTFEGAIIGEEGDLNNLFTFFGKIFETNIGRSRSAQYGKISFEFVNNTPEDIPVNTAKEKISLTLLSDTIIYNKYGFSTTDVTELENELKKRLGNKIKIEKSFIKAGEIENFVSVWRLRKPSETCFLKGSCFLLSGINNNSDKLKELQINGIGKRTQEGFGRVAIGIQTKEKLTKRDYGEVPDATVPLPATTKKIAEEAIKGYIKKKIELEALTEYTKFKELPTKSLISKLEMAVKTRDKNNITKYLINNNDDFTNYLNKLRSTAQDNLKKCHNSNNTLLDFLQKKEVKIDNNIMIDIQAICNEINFNPATDIDFTNSLYRLYFETFFSAMRKRKKKEGN